MINSNVCGLHPLKYVLVEADELSLDAKPLVTAFERHQHRMMAVCDVKSTIHLWSFRDGKSQLIHALPGHHSEATAMCFLRDEKEVAVGSSKGVLSLWNIERPKGTKSLDAAPTVFKAHSSSVRVMLTMGERLATAADAAIKLWDLRTRNCIVELKHHKAAVGDLDMLEANSLLASGGCDNLVKIWDLRYPEKFIATVGEHNDEVSCVRFCPSNRMLISGGNDKIVKLYQPNGKNYGCVG